MKFLNLGCGNRYNTDWVNIDFKSSSKLVIEHNLLNGIPFPGEEFDVVYHSHVLEHFSKTQAVTFLKECHRVLKSGGIIRIAVPDLEKIARSYLENLDRALQGDFEASKNYEWIMLELYDQAVRNFSGGNMAKYLYKPEINEAFVYERLGNEAKDIREAFFNKQGTSDTEIGVIPVSKARKFFKMEFYRNKLKQFLFPEELKFIELGKFRLGGEVHQWMYDRYSLTKLLTELDFIEIDVKPAFDSNIPEWNKFELESKNGLVFKPDSLFIEGIKK